MQKILDFQIVETVQSEIEDTALAVKGIDVPSISHMKESLQVKTTYIMGGKVSQPPLDNEFVYIDE
jgi:hypothetical protein